VLRQVVSRWPVTAEARVHTQRALCGIYDVQSVIFRLVFLRVLRFSLVNMDMNYNNIPLLSDVVRELNSCALTFMHFRQKGAAHLTL
jgi:hypothetical protein